MSRLYVNKEIGCQRVTENIRVVVIYLVTVALWRATCTCQGWVLDLKDTNTTGSRPNVTLVVTWGRYTCIYRINGELLINVV